MTWEQAVAEYIEHYRSLGRASSTVAGLNAYLSYLVEFSRRQGHQQPCDFTESDLAALQQRLQWEPGLGGQPLTECGIARILEVVRSFFRWAVERRHVLLDPTRNLLVRRVRSFGKSVLTVDEVQAMLEAPLLDTVLGLRDRAVLETLYGTGLRRGECHVLDLDDVDLGGQTLTVRRSKNGFGRVLPLGNNMVAVLVRYLEKSRPVLYPHLGEKALFLSRDGLRLAYHQIAKIVNKAARDAGMKRSVGPHELRHALATHLLASGADLRMVQAMLGHESLMSTERYTHLRPQDAFREFNDKHPRARRKPPEET